MITPERQKEDLLWSISVCDAIDDISYGSRYAH
jgi:hypothetical protein